MTYDQAMQVARTHLQCADRFAESRYAEIAAAYISYARELRESGDKQ